jgi:DNA-directed RNA polymerase specialized sigma24 family protein
MHALTITHVETKEEQTVESVAMDNPLIVDELFLKYHSMLYNKYYTLTGSKEDAEWVTTQTFIYFWEHQNQYKSYPSIYDFLLYCSAKCFSKRMRQRLKTRKVHWKVNRIDLNNLLRLNIF